MPTPPSSAGSWQLSIEAFLRQVEATRGAREQLSRAARLNFFALFIQAEGSIPFEAFARKAHTAFLSHFGLSATEVPLLLLNKHDPRRPFDLVLPECG